MPSLLWSWSVLVFVKCRLPRQIGVCATTLQRKGNRWGGGKRGSWQGGASHEICPLALGMVQMGVLSASTRTVFWAEKGAYKLVFFFLSLFYHLFICSSLSSPSSFSAISCKTNDIMSKSVNASAVQVQVIGSISWASLRTPGEHLSSITEKTLGGGES